MRGRTQRVGWEYAAALTAAAFGWAAAASWRGLVADPAQYQGPAVFAALLIAVVGATGRSLRLRWYAVAGLQVLVLLVWFHQRQNPDGFAAGLVPTPNGLAEVIDQVRDGSSAINTYAAPVSSSFTDAPVYLLACSLAVLLLVDLIACGLRLPAWAGLPALVAVTIPISVLDEGLPSSVYVATGLLFALLLVVVEADRVQTWGPVVGDPARRGPRPGRLPLGSLGAPGLVIGVAATALALLVSAGVPVGGGLFKPDRGAGAGSGKGGGGVSLTNPMVDLRRDLVRNDRVPLLEVHTQARDLTYLRLTVLDDLNEDTWTPSVRNVGAANTASGPLPVPEEAGTGTGVFDDWVLSTTDDFTTAWLPTPGLTRTIDIAKGQWRYDPRFGDIANADETPPRQVPYALTSERRTLDPEQLAAAGAPPADLKAAYTRLPELPAGIKEKAEEITASGSTEHAKAVLLQDWFRSTGGFTYSLTPAPGEGLEQLSRFITTDKVGYCEQFAAAMAVMARALGIPTRVVVGFLSPSETIPNGFRYTSDDLHAWPEIYFSGSGWVRFEPTPSIRTGVAPSWTRTSPDTPDASPTTERPTAEPSQRPTAAPSTPTVDPSTTRSSDSSSPVRLISVGIAVLLVLALLLMPAVRRTRQRRRRLAVTSDPSHDIEAAWLELQATARDFGAPWQDGRSPRMTADAIRGWVRERSAQEPSAQDLDALDAAVAQVERVRYSAAPGTGDSARVRSAVERWNALIASTATSGQTWRSRVLPRSITRPGGPSRAAQYDDADDLAAKT